MREESHLDDMRSAIRGDFERLAERRGEQDLLRVPDEQVPADEGDQHPPSDPEQQPAEAEAELAPEQEPVPASEPDAAEEHVIEDQPRSWLDRLLGR